MVKGSGFLGSIAKNPSFLALAALGVGLFIFRDKISGFFSDISGGAAGIKSVTDLGMRATDGLNVQLDNIDNFFKDPFGDQVRFFENFEFPTFTNPFESFQVDKITEEIAKIFESREIGTTDITETPAAEGRASDRGRIIPQIVEPFIPENQNVQTDIEGNTFSGGGISFQGGTVRETPIEFLSLSQIIDRFGVSASRAADIRAQALNDFGDFDFGTNTFRDEGIPELQNIGAVSDQQFQGLTAEEIVLRLTGGSISNF